MQPCLPPPQAGSADGRERSASIEVEVVEGDPPTLVSGCSPPWLCTQIQGAQLVIPAKLILECRCEVEVRKGAPSWHSLGLGRGVGTLDRCHGPDASRFPLVSVGVLIATPMS